MTQEDKELLLKYLCAILPYGVKVRISSESDGYLHENITILDIDNLHKYILDGGYYKHGLFYKTPGFQLFPYLRPMSSMTEEERKIYIEISSHLCGEIAAKTMIDWLLSNHFDFLGLIPKGLAIEVTEENNPYKE